MRLFPLRSASLVVCSLIILCAPPAARTNAQKGRVAGDAGASALEQAILDEINLARARPAAYAAFLEELKPNFKGREFKVADKVSLMTEEGVGVVDEAVRFLRATPPMSALAMSHGMCSGARVLVSDQGTSGGTGHKGGDGTFCEQRVERFGSWKEPIGENLSYSNDTARERVVSLIVDDGVPNRGHRRRIFDPTYKVAGVACGTHKLGTMCVITFAGGFADRSPAAQSVAPPRNAAPQAPSAAVKQF